MRSASTRSSGSRTVTKHWRRGCVPFSWGNLAGTGGCALGWAMGSVIVVGDAARRPSTLGRESAQERDDEARRDGGPRERDGDVERVPVEVLAQAHRDE